LSYSEILRLVPPMVLLQHCRPTLGQLYAGITSLVHFLLLPLDQIFALLVWSYTIVVNGHHQSLAGLLIRCSTRLLFLMFCIPLPIPFFWWKDLLQLSITLVLPRKSESEKLCFTPDGKYFLPDERGRCFVWSLKSLRLRLINLYMTATSLSFRMIIFLYLGTAVLVKINIYARNYQGKLIPTSVTNVWSQATIAWGWPIKWIDVYGNYLFCCLLQMTQGARAFGSAFASSSRFQKIGLTLLSLFTIFLFFVLPLLALNTFVSVWRYPRLVLLGAILLYPYLISRIRWAAPILEGRAPKRAPSQASINSWLQYVEDECRLEREYKSCPHCQAPVLRTAACPMMVCGQDGDGAARHARVGCGHRFNINDARPYRANLRNHPLFNLVQPWLETQPAATHSLLRRGTGTQLNHRRATARR
jgi:hypothetical protein